MPVLVVDTKKIKQLLNLSSYNVTFSHINNFCIQRVFFLVMQNNMEYFTIGTSLYYWRFTLTNSKCKKMTPVTCDLCYDFLKVDKCDSVQIKL